MLKYRDKTSSLLNIACVDLSLFRSKGEAILRAFEPESLFASREPLLRATKNYRQEIPKRTQCPTVVFIHTFRKDGLATCSTASRNVSVVEGYLLVKHPSVNNIHVYRRGDVLLLSVQNSAKFLLL